MSKLDQLLRFAKCKTRLLHKMCVICDLCVCLILVKSQYFRNSNVSYKMEIKFLKDSIYVRTRFSDKIFLPKPNYKIPM